MTRPASGSTSTPQAPASTSPRCTQGARSNHKNLPAEPADHAIGRSRGGRTTKVHALTDPLCAPITLLLSPGQASDNPMLAPLLDTLANRDRRQARLLADKAYSHPSTRARLRQAGIAHTIPERSDQIERRRQKGSHGGRPPNFDRDTYRHRNTIERSFNRFKQWRGIATRYDKYALTYLGGVTLAAVVIHHRTHLPDTP